MKSKSLATKKTAVWTILLVLLMIGVVVSRSDRTEYFFNWNWKRRKHKKTGTPTIKDLKKKNLSDLRNVAYLTKKYNSGVTYPSYNNSGDNYYNYCKHHQVMGLCNNAIVKKSCRDECRK